jgi:hypothetical protein
MSDPHQRQLIRTAVVGMLANRTSAGGNVKPTTVRRYNAKRPGELPAIAVYTMTEDSDRDSATTAPRELARELEIEIAAAAICPADDPGAPLDALAQEIEAVIDADPYLGRTVGNLGALLVSSGVSFPDVDADPLIGIITLTYSATYYTSPAPQTNLDDFLRADVTTRIVGATDDNALHDEIVLQQEAPSP